LEAWAGKDLVQLDAKAGIISLSGPPAGPYSVAFEQQLRALTGDPPDPTDEFVPWWVDRFTSGEAAWMVLDAYPGCDNPDTSAIRVYLFDRHWKRFFKLAFPTGYDRNLAKAQVRRSKLLHEELLVTTTYPNAGSIDSKGEWKAALGLRQYYALVGDQLVLVRLEDHEGRSVRNLYHTSAPNLGPPVSGQTSDQWIRSLRSNNPVEQLAALVWLTGMHLSSSEPRYSNVNQESVADALTFEAVRDAPETSEALSELRNSKNRWAREYARLGLRPRDE
jgi:hypothetical protein